MQQHKKARLRVTEFCSQACTPRLWPTSEIILVSIRPSFLIRIKCRNSHSRLFIVKAGIRPSQCHICSRRLRMAQPFWRSSSRKVNRGRLDLCTSPYTDPYPETGCNSCSCFGSGCDWGCPQLFCGVGSDSDCSSCCGFCSCSGSSPSPDF